MGSRAADCCLGPDVTECSCCRSGNGLASFRFKYLEASPWLPLHCHNRQEFSTSAEQQRRQRTSLCKSPPVWNSCLRQQGPCQCCCFHAWHVPLPLAQPPASFDPIFVNARVRPATPCGTKRTIPFLFAPTTRTCCQAQTANREGLTGPTQSTHWQSPNAPSHGWL